MAYNGSVELIGGLKQKNNGTFALVDASAVRVDDSTRLDTALAGKVSFTEAQELSEAQKELARNNIGAALQNDVVGLWQAIGKTIFETEISKEYSTSTQEYFPVSFFAGHNYRMRILFATTTVDNIHVFTATATNVSYRVDYLGEFLSNSAREELHDIEVEKTFVASADANYLNIRYNPSTGLQEYTINIEEIGVPDIDSTMTIAGDAADAKAVGDRLSGIDANVDLLFNALTKAVLDQSVSEEYSESTSDKYIPVRIISGHTYKLIINFQSTSINRVRINTATGIGVSAWQEEIFDGSITNNKIEKIFVATKDADYIGIRMYNSVGTQNYRVILNNIIVPNVDKTLTIEDDAADAKVTGDQIRLLKSSVTRTAIDESDVFTPESTNVAINHFFAEDFEVGARYELTIHQNHASLEYNGIRVHLASATGLSYLVQEIEHRLTMADGESYVKVFTVDAEASEAKYLCLRYWGVEGIEDDFDIILRRCYDYPAIVDDLKGSLMIRKTIASGNINASAENSSVSWKESKAVNNNGFDGKYVWRIAVNYAPQPILISAIVADNTGTTIQYVRKAANTGETFELEIAEKDILDAACLAGVLISRTYVAENVDVDFGIRYELPYSSINQDFHQLLLRQKHGRMQFGAHRGARNYAPPDTLAAYRVAGELGFDWAWLARLVVSADGTIWVTHYGGAYGPPDVPNMTDTEIMEYRFDRNGTDIEYFDDSELRLGTLEEIIKICRKYGMKMCFRADEIGGSYDDPDSSLYKLIQLVKDYNIQANEAAYSFATNKITLLNALRQHLGNDIEISVFDGNTPLIADYVSFFDNNNVTNRSAIVPFSIGESGAKELHRNNIKVYMYDATPGLRGPSREEVLNAASWGVELIHSGFWYYLPY